jgi:MFS family permease
MRVPFYYGWLVLAASAVSELLAQGATSYSAGLFVLPLQAEFHISRADANSSILILFLGAIFMVPLAGRALDRFAVRTLVIVGAIIFGGALAGIALSHSLWLMALLLLIPAALGFGLIGPVTTTTLATRWFWKRRGLALGLAAVATSGGGLVVVPLLARAIQNNGWRAGLLGEALIITVIVIVLALVFLRDRPDQMGLADDPENQGRESHAGVPRRWRDMLASRAFWIPALALASISGICQAVVVTLVPYGVALGVPAPRAALAISVFAICAAVTKIIAGLLADHVPPLRLIIAAIAFMALAQALLWLSPGLGGLVAGAGLAGTALGCALPTAAGMLANAFGSAVFGAAMGTTFALMAMGSLIAARFIGMVYDVSHRYDAGFETFLAVMVVILVIALMMRPRAAAS